MAKTSGVVLFLGSELIVQRRDAGAPVSANLLSLFGGHIEANETPYVALIRELGEETSLPLAELKFKYLTQMPLHGQSEAYIYTADVKSDHFKVFEGERAEKYKLEELLKRSDLDPDTRLILQYIEKEGK